MRGVGVGDTGTNGKDWSNGSVTFARHVDNVVALKHRFAASIRPHLHRKVSVCVTNLEDKKETQARS